MAFKFEELRVWDILIGLTAEVNELIKTFPTDERFVLSSQIQRAADSVALILLKAQQDNPMLNSRNFLGIPLGPQSKLSVAFILEKEEKS